MKWNMIKLHDISKDQVQWISQQLKDFVML